MPDADHRLDLLISALFNQPLHLRLYDNGPKSVSLILSVNRVMTDLLGCLTEGAPLEYCIDKRGFVRRIDT
jgi:hypothetical protein